MWACEAVFTQVLASLFRTLADKRAAILAFMQHLLRHNEIHFAGDS